MAIALRHNDRGISTTSTAFTHDKAVRDSIDFDEARAILDFDVVREPVCRPCGEIRTPDGKHVYEAKGEAIADLYNLVRTDTYDVVPVGRSVGREFTPVQHWELFDFLRDRILPEMPELSLETVATMYGGASSLITGDFGEGFRLPHDQSDHRTRIIFSNPMGRGSLILGFTSIRVICQNTLRAARREVRCSEDGFKIQHSTNAQYLVKCALESIHKQVEAAKELRERQTVLASTEVTADQVRAVLDPDHAVLRGQYLRSGVGNRQIYRYSLRNRRSFICVTFGCHPEVPHARKTNRCVRFQ